jgi:hypothetical protein
MALDPKKLKTYLGTTEARPGRPAPPNGEAKPAVPKSVRPFLKAGQSVDDLLGYLERGDEVTPEQLGRLLDQKVSYMELPEKAGAFACGACGYAAEGAMCRNPLVLAPVSAKHGCCDLFWPSHGEPSFPPAADED